MKEKDIIEISNSFQSFDEMYKQINNIQNFDFCLDSDGVWKRLELKWMLTYFQNNEEYEKCAVIKVIIDNHLIGSESKQLELNEKLKEIVKLLKK